MADVYATDGSGYHLISYSSIDPAVRIYAKDGSLVYADPTPSYTMTTYDANGNIQSMNISAQVSHCTYSRVLTDTLNRTVMTGNCPQSGTQALYLPNSQGTTTQVSLQWGSLGTLYMPLGGNCYGTGGSGTCQFPSEILKTITLADGSTYSFTYDCNKNFTGDPVGCSNTNALPGGTSDTWGVMTSMTLPSGGTVNFSYSVFKDSFIPWGQTQGRQNYWLTGVSYGGSQWTYTPATSCGSFCQTITVARPDGGNEVYTFGTGTGAAALNTKIQYYNGAVTGTPALTVQNAFRLPAGCTPFVQCNSTGYSTNYIVPQTVTVTAPGPGGNLVAQTSYVFDQFTQNNTQVTTSKLLSKSEYPFGIGSPGPLQRKTVYSYLDDANSNYLSVGPINVSSSALTSGIIANFMDRVVDMQVQDGSGSIKAETKTAYDSTTLTSITGVQSHDDSNFGSSHTTRGNPTQIQKLVSAPTFITTATLNYDTTGQITQVQDGNGNLTTISYADKFYNDASPASNPPSSFTPSQPTNAYPTTITLPIIGAQYLRYYYGSGKTAFSVDQNGADTYFHYLDALDRPTHTFLPITNGNRGWTLMTYSAGGTQTDTYSAINDTAPSSGCASCTHSRANLDTFGRTVQNTLVNDPDGATYTAITYDSSGRTHTVSNPYRSTSDPTYGLATYAFDVLGRTTQVTEADGSVAKAYYGAGVTGTGVGGLSAQICAPATYGYGFPTLQIDEAGKKIQSWSDALGRVIEVDEPDSTGTLSLATCYTYDTMDNLTKVEQKGGSTDPAQWRVRTFAYDGLSRLTSATEPESGTTTYTYDNNDNLLTKTSPAPNQTGTATVTTTYSYDALNRLKTTTYSDGTTPSVQYSYDVVPQYANSPIPQGSDVGRLTTTWSNGKGTKYSHDKMGRVAYLLDCVEPTSCNNSLVGSYQFDLAGNITQASYQMWYWNGTSYVSTTSPLTFNQSFDTAARPTQLTSNLVDSQHPASLLTVDSNVGYNPSGAMRKVTLGNALTETAAYNKRLQPCRMNVNSSGVYYSQCTDSVPGGNVLDFTYGFNSGTSDNGNIASWSATGSQTFSRTYTYDSLNRIKTMSDSASSQSCKGLSWTIDPWGNRTDQTVTAGACYTFHQSADTSNRLVGAPYQYDAAGNMIHDASHAYTYDAENRVIQVDGGSTATYAYDPLGRRATKTIGATTTNYAYDLGQNSLFETQGSSWVTAYIYLGGALAAKYNNGTTYFLHGDHLGSIRLVTAMNQSVYDSMDYHPFGEQISGATGTTHKFTGYEHDSESGLDYASARHYSSNLGRFMSPDPMSGSPENPQSWNRYSYVMNNPMNATDPSGMCGEEDGWTGCDFDTGWDGGVCPVFVCGYLGYGSPDQSPSNWLNFTFGGWSFGIGVSIDLTSISYPSDGSYMAQIMNNPALEADWNAKMNGAYDMVQTGTQITAMNGLSVFGAAIPTLGKALYYLNLASAAPAPTIPVGSFSIRDWRGYPEGLPKPQGPFRIVEGQEYKGARAAANSANATIRRQTPGMNPNLEIHEIQPVKFGGSPTSLANKSILTEEMHDAYSAWWSRLLRDLTELPE